MSHSELKESIARAVDAISSAESILIGAGAGMGVDSGLPDFRGKEGFWEAYPVFKEMGYSFHQMANPAWFLRDPSQAWGFYGHRLNLYRETQPHKGFQILKRWVEVKQGSGFVFTSNVDGHFQAAGFLEEQVYECHGSIHWLQSCHDSRGEVWSAEGVKVKVDKHTYRAKGKLPMSLSGRNVCRPNILMFDDFMWNGERYDHQRSRLGQWLKSLRRGRAVVIEIGAGKSVPTVRFNCERYADILKCPLIRINPRDADGPEGTISITMGGCEALEKIEVAL